MRIISGEQKGRKIKVVPSEKMRPTTDRVREAVFSVLQYDLDFGAFEAVDLYAGTGSMGLEALSRGVAKVTFIEREGKLAKNIEENIKDLGFADRARVVRGDIPMIFESLLANLDPGLRTLFLIDPPYTAHPGLELLEQMAKTEVLSQGSVVLLGRPKRMEISEDIESFGNNLFISEQKSKKYGDTVIHYYYF